MPDNEKKKTRLSAADFAVRRRLVGLTHDEIAAEFSVNARTVRTWESGQEPVPYRITVEMEELVRRHGRETAEILNTASLVDIPRKSGWHIAAAARALDANPTLNLEWSQA